MPDGTRTLRTSGAITDTLEMSLIEQLLLIVTDPNMVFILLSLGVLAIQVELTHPGTWVPGFIGVTCLALAIYGLGVLPVNYFGLVFIITAFVLFVLEIKAPPGVLTAAGVTVVGELLCSSPAYPVQARFCAAGHRSWGGLRRWAPLRVACLLPSDGQNLPGKIGIAVEYRLSGQVG
jgi:membrane-bound ClpP family serine protease